MITEFILIIIALGALYSWWNSRSPKKLPPGDCLDQLHKFLYTYDEELIDYGHKGASHISNMSQSQLFLSVLSFIVCHLKKGQVRFSQSWATSLNLSSTRRRPAMKPLTSW